MNPTRLIENEISAHLAQQREINLNESSKLLVVVNKRIFFFLFLFESSTLNVNKRTGDELDNRFVKYARMIYMITDRIIKEKEDL